MIKYKCDLDRNLDKDKDITSHRHLFDHMHTFLTLNYIFVRIRRYFYLHNSQVGKMLSMSNL